jgi:CRISPR-associated protein Cmr4
VKLFFSNVYLAHLFCSELECKIYFALFCFYVLQVNPKNVFNPNRKYQKIYINMSQANAILGLLTETSLHAGVGQMMSVIDLPIQRESHTRWPCVYGSAVKGAMRSLADDKTRNQSENEKKDWVSEVFGPGNDQENDKGNDKGNDNENKKNNEYAGALAIGDARLLLLPVRSLTTHFKWVTCPALLKRLQADLRRLQFAADFSIPNIPQNDKALIATQNHTALFLEEFRFRPQPDNTLDDLIKIIAPLMGREDAEAVLKQQLTIVNDDIFRHLSEYATPVNAHIAIENETKIVKPGALWYEESLPPDTLLYVSLVANPVRKSGVDKNPERVMGHIQDLFDAKHPYLQLGGNETVGMGWCKVTVKMPPTAASNQTGSNNSHSDTSNSSMRTKVKTKKKTAANEEAISPISERWGTPNGYYNQKRWG